MDDDDNLLVGVVGRFKLFAEEKQQVQVLELSFVVDYNVDRIAIFVFESVLDFLPQVPFSFDFVEPEFTGFFSVEEIAINESGILVIGKDQQIFVTPFKFPQSYFPHSVTIIPF